MGIVEPEPTEADADASLLECVRAVWIQALPSIAFSPDMSWQDAGLDSLKVLELALRLEQALGRKVTFDGLTPDSTANDLIRRLSEEPASPEAPGDLRHHMFFVPGLMGDDPAQAVFRRAFRREVRLETLDMAGVETPGRVLGDIPARARRLTDTVMQRRPHGDIRLTGFSFGALVAQEMARQLESQGRAVVFLGLIDGFLRPPVWRPLDTSPSPRLAAGVEARERWKHRIVRWTGPALRGSGAMELARRLVSTGAVRTRPLAQAAGARLVRAWGFWAMEAWRPGVCEAPTLLVTSDDFARFSSIEEWRAACPRLRVVAAPGGHYHLFEPSAMDRMVPAFLAALADGVATPL